MATPRAIGDAQRSIERRLSVLRLDELGMLLGLEGGFFYCGYCQATDHERILHGPAARLLGPSGTPVIPRDATRWTCLRCGLVGSRAQLVRLVVENVTLLEDLATQVLAKEADR